jgi:hypothetical protein
MKNRSCSAEWRAMRLPRRLVVLTVLLWVAFLARGGVHALVSPMWDGFDEPFHLAFVAFVGEHGRPPGYTEPSLPRHYLEANRHLPSFLGYGAPSFAEWRGLDARSRKLSRELMKSETARLTRDERVDYIGPNYQRQQGPLFYFLAAPVWLAVADASLPAQLVALRLFCVALASLAIPVAAMLLFQIGRAPLLVVGLPIVALLPNTPFFVQRLTNDALVWPLAAAALLAWTYAIRHEEKRDRALAVGGLLTLAGIWTKLTMLPMIGAAAAAVVTINMLSSRPGWFRHSLLALGIPVAGSAPLFIWTRLATGSWTGLAEARAASRIVPADLVDAVTRVISPQYWRQLLETHLFSGGWAFVRAPDAAYIAAAIALGALVLAAQRRYGVRAPVVDRPAMLPLITFAVTFLAAVIYHAITGTIAAKHTPGFPPIGAEGWYLDILRPVEAAGLGAALLIVCRMRASLVAPAVVLTLAAVDLAAVFLLMIPQWSGGRLPLALSDIAAAAAAAPVEPPPLVIASVSVVWLGAIVAAAVTARGVTVEE